MALDTLNQFDESETFLDYELRVARTTQGIQLNSLPEHSRIEFNEVSIDADNSWLHEELGQVGKTTGTARTELIARITERLRALEERLDELEQSVVATTSTKDAAKGRLAAILARPDYATSVQEESAFARLSKRFWEWFLKLLPRPKPLAAGRYNFLGLIAQILVIALAAVVVVYAVRILVVRVRRRGRPRRKAKIGPRIVLGERLEPEQSASDLFSEAETLARNGELRAAIRKAYIALLVELGERKVISLAQHKTNLDYLRAVHEKQPLAENMRRMTDHFERHWYGLIVATESDWLAFRDRYKETLLWARGL